MADYNEKTFEGMSDMDLVVLQHEARQVQDEEFRIAILTELSRRVKAKEEWRNE